MGCNAGLTRQFGRARPGERVVDKVPGERGSNISTIGAIDLDGFRAGLSVPGAIDGDIMSFFVEEMLAPTLKPGEVVVMDNCPIHKIEEIEGAIEARGAWVIFLPPYSPDFNPIENCWSKVKSILRSLKPRSIEKIFDALVEAFSSIDSQNIQGWFSHCGYEAACK
jgi:transposase